MKIVILGSGIIGQTTGKEFIRQGCSVEFRDIDQRVIEALRMEGFNATQTAEAFDSDIDVFFICVPTPTKNNLPDLEAVSNALNQVGLALQFQEKFSVVAIRSTVPVGTAKDIATPILEKASERKAGVDFGVCSNPEYLRESKASFDFKNPKMVIIGADDSTSKSILQELYHEFEAVTHILSSREAEMHKYVHNLFNACKISYFNELRSLCRSLDISAENIFPLVAISAEASWNPLYGIQDLGPFGGACLPKDVSGFLGWVEKRTDMSLPLIKAIIEVNQTEA